VDIPAFIYLLLYFGFVLFITYNACTPEYDGNVGMKLRMETGSFGTELPFPGIGVCCRGADGSDTLGKWRQRPDTDASLTQGRERELRLKLGSFSVLEALHAVLGH
jgi:hypothetical protein